MPAALVTGASTGIGRACVLRLDRLGWDVFAGVRREADAEALRAAGGERIVPVRVDLTDEASIATAGEQVGERTRGRLDGLVNNAGIAVPGPLEVLPLADFRRQLEVNVTGQLAVTQAMLPHLRAARGRIVFMSSIGGRMALPFTGAYHASKYAIEAIGDVFRQELEPWDIRVSLVEPGSVATPIWDKGEREAEEIMQRADPRQEDLYEDLYGERIETFRRVVRQTAERGIDPEKVAERVEHALTAKRPRTRYLVGVDASVQARVGAVLPDRLVDRLVAAAMWRSGS